ncbi:MAG: F0F1 ATP synthase subunit delta [Actinomycetia bacterium]|nr:F0F1 ATP synthase subunit delta [Actinomycetes bacterium]
MSDDVFHQWAAASDAQAPAVGVPDELWAMADVIASQASLGAALVDPGRAPTQRAGLVEGVFGGRASAQCVALVGQAAGLEWASPADLEAGVRRMAVRTTWRVAEAQGAADEVHGQVAQIADAVLGDPALELALNGAGTSPEHRRGVLEHLLGGKVHPLALQLARFAVVDGPGNYVDAVEANLDEASDLRGRQRVRATFAVAPDATQRKRLASELERIYGRGVDVEVHVDARVIGGARLQIGGDVIDGSVAARLDAARREMAAAQA